MQQNVTKLCADSLRSFLKNEYNIKLKSGHAHEIVAGCFGYNSKISLLADKEYSLNNLEKSELILFNNNTSLLQNRLENLEGLSPEMPSVDILINRILSVFKSNELYVKKTFSSYEDFALLLAEEHLQQHIGHLRMSPMPQWITDVIASLNHTQLSLLVTFNYPTVTGKQNRYCKFDITLPRMAGNIGFGAPNVMPTFYSGQFRDPDFNPDFGIVEAL